MRFLPNRHANLKAQTKLGGHNGGRILYPAQRGKDGTSPSFQQGTGHSKPIGPFLSEKKIAYFQPRRKSRFRLGYSHGI